MPDEGRGFPAVADQNRHDRVCSPDGFQTQCFEPLPEAVAQGAQVAEQPLAPSTVQNLECRHACRGLRRRNGIGVDVEGCRFSQIGDQRPARNHITPVYTQRLAQGGDQEVRSGPGHRLRTPPTFAECADAVGVVDDRDDAFLVGIFVLPANRRNLIQRGVIAPHAEYPVGNDTKPLPPDPCPTPGYDPARPFSGGRTLPCSPDAPVGRR